MHSFVSVSAALRFLRLDTMRPLVRPETKLREWFSSFTRIPFTRYYPAYEGNLPPRINKLLFLSPRRGIGEAESVTGRFYSILVGDLVEELVRNG